LPSAVTGRSCFSFSVTERTTPQSAQGADARAADGGAAGAGDCAQAGKSANATQAGHDLMGFSRFRMCHRLGLVW
jgi:hypothetical protein